MSTSATGPPQFVKSRSHHLRNLALGIGLILIAFIAFAWLRPLTVWRAVGRFTLWRAGIHSEYAQVGPYRIHYYSGGEGAPVVFVHGLSADALQWIKPMITLKRQRYRVYALDLLGHGDSVRPDIAYSIEQQSEMLRQFLSTQNIRSADLVGVSMGGWIVLNLAIEHPEVVRRAVVADAAGLWFETNLTADTFLPTTPVQLQNFWHLLSPRPLKLPDAGVRDFLRERGQQEWIVRRIFASFETRQDFLDGRLQSIHVPVLLLWGKQERLIPLVIGEEMQRDIPQSSLLVCPDSGHLAVFECWDGFEPAIANFLASPQPPEPVLREIPASP